jgi:hypothetical protein
MKMGKASKVVNEELASRHRELAGIKAYVTSRLTEDPMVISGFYRRLFQIEKSFRMAKSDPRARLWWSNPHPTAAHPQAPSGYTEKGAGPGRPPHKMTDQTRPPHTHKKEEWKNNPKIVLPLLNSKLNAGGVLLSHTLPGAVPSAQAGLASGFGKGPGVTPPLKPPTKHTKQHTPNHHSGQYAVPFQTLHSGRNIRFNQHNQAQRS